MQHIKFQYKKWPTRLKVKVIQMIKYSAILKFFL